MFHKEIIRDERVSNRWIVRRPLITNKNAFLDSDTQQISSSSLTTLRHDSTQRHCDERREFDVARENCDEEALKWLFLLIEGIFNMNLHVSRDKLGWRRKSPYLFLYTGPVWDDYARYGEEIWEGEALKLRSWLFLKFHHLHISSLHTRFWSRISNRNESQHDESGEGPSNDDRSDEYEERSKKTDDEHCLQWRPCSLHTESINQFFGQDNWKCVQFLMLFISKLRKIVKYMPCGRRIASRRPQWAECRPLRQCMCLNRNDDIQVRICFTG